jgi:capsular polysaccharide biosynthesis protein
MEEEIDLRQYIEVLFKYKFWIAGLAVLAALVAFAMGSRRAVVYQAEASLAILRDRAEVILEPNYRTLSEDELSPRTDIGTLRATFATLAGSPSVAVAVLEQMGERLTVSAKELQEQVSASVNGNLIVILASDRDPQLAADIANTWAQQAGIYINSIYGQPTQPMELHLQFQDTQGRHQTALGELEAFLAQNQIPDLEREIQYRQDLIDSFQESLTDNEAAIYDEALAHNLKLLSDYYAELASIEQVLVDARSLYESLDSAGAPATKWAEALAFIGIQNRAFGVPGQPLQVALDGAAPATSHQDLERLIEMLENKSANVRAAVVQQEQRLFDVEAAPADVATGNPLEQRIQSLTGEMLALQSQLEVENARYLELTRARDLAWETFKTVARKLAEAEVTEQVSGSEVRLADQALWPGLPVARGRVMNTALAGVLGLMVGVCGAFVIEWWRQEPHPEEEKESETQASQVDN